MTPRPVPGHREDGLVAGGEVLFGGVLVLIFATMLVVNLWLIIDAKVAVSAASREAARRIVEAGNDAGIGDAQRAAAEAVAGHHRSALRIKVTVDGKAATRCGRISVTVRSDVALVLLPLWHLNQATTQVSSTHTELIDGYRSGLLGEAHCG